MRFSIMAINIINMAMIYHVFFAHEDNNIIMHKQYRKFKIPIYLVIQISILCFEIFYLIREGGKTKFYGPLVCLDVTFQILMYLSCIGSYFWHKLGNSQDDYINDAILHRERHLKLAQKSKAVKAEDLAGNFLVEEGFDEEGIKKVAQDRRKESMTRSGNFNNLNAAINREDSLPNADDNQDADEFYTLKTTGQNNDAEINPT